MGDVIRLVRCECGRMSKGLMCRRCELRNLTRAIKRKAAEAATKKPVTPTIA